MPRLFIGTFIANSDQEKLAALHSHKAKLEDFWHTKVRLVKPEKLHLTWLFLGVLENPESNNSQDNIVSVLEKIAKEEKSTELIYSQIEFWPNNKNARHLVLTPKNTPETVLKIQKKISSQLMPKAEKKDYQFHPHITLLRIPEPLKEEIQIPDWLPLADLLPIKHKINNICLIESHLGTQKNEYIILNRFELI